MADPDVSPIVVRHAPVPAAEASPQADAAGLPSEGAKKVVHVSGGSRPGRQEERHGSALLMRLLESRAHAASAG